MEPHEAGPLGPLVVRADDGALRIPMRGLACSCLAPDKRCSVYEDRPTVCRAYPYHVHAGRRIQATISFGCPGVTVASGSADAEAGARRAIEAALALPGALARAADAKATFARFDQRMKEWGVEAAPDKLRSAFAAHLDAIARPESLPGFLAAIAEGDLTLDARDAVARLLDTQAESDLSDLLVEGARDAFDGPPHALWVEPDHAWTTPQMRGDEVELRRGDVATRFDPASLPVDWTEEAGGVLSNYLRRLTLRDRTEGAAAWVVDASGYQATLPAAYARVLGEAALQVALRAGLAAEEAGAAEITPDLAWRGVRAYETSYHSLPSLGSIL